VSVRVVRTRRGARLVDDDVTLSEVLDGPGPTHTLFDVLAACVAAFATGPRFLMLGFAGGGVVAPLRAMGYDAPVRAVVLARAGEALFRELSSAWCGPVELAHADAAGWLRSASGRWDAILEDLSVPSPAGTIKPYDSIDALPALIRTRLAPGGVAVTNLLPLPGTSWDALTARVVHGHERALVVHLDEYENRVVLCGPILPDAATSSRAVRERLRSIGSDQAARLSVRTLRR